MNSLFTFATIVKPEYTDHPLDPQKTDRCSEMAYIRVKIILHISNNSVVWAGFRPVVVDRWTLFEGGRYCLTVYSTSNKSDKTILSQLYLIAELPCRYSSQSIPNTAKSNVLSHFFPTIHIFKNTMLQQPDFSCFPNTNILVWFAN
jgi:hypothetical protein